MYLNMRVQIKSFPIITQNDIIFLQERCIVTLRFMLANHTYNTKPLNVLFDFVFQTNTAQCMFICFISLFVYNYYRGTFKSFLNHATPILLNFYFYKYKRLVFIIHHTKAYRFSPITVPR